MALRKEILNEMDNQFLSIAELAQKANIDRTTLHKFLNDGTNIGIGALINISFVLFPKNHNEVMCKWCLQMEKPENMRLAMEYTALNGNLEALKKIIHKQEHEGRKNKQWAEVYKMFLEFRETEEHSSLLNDVRNYKTNDSQLKIFLRLIEIYVLFQKQKYNVMFELAKDLESQINKIDCSLIRESYNARLCEMFAYGYLAQNDVKKARYYANVVFSSILCANLKSGASYIVGMSYLFENKQECIANLDLCDRLLAERLNSAPKYANFAKIYWGEKPDTMSTSDSAFYAAKSGDKENAITFIKMSIEEEGGVVSPFKTFYKGLAERDVKSLWESYGEFLSQGNLFFANLPKNILHSLGESEAALNAYYKILAS